MKKKETITITKIEGETVKYSGSQFFSGSHISCFPDEPEVGKKYILVSDFRKPSVVKPYKDNRNGL